MSMQQIAFERALNILRGLGLSYAVIDQDGTKHGDLEVAPPKPERGPRVVRNRGLNDRFQYIEKITNCKPGEVITFDLGNDEGDLVTALRGCISGTATKVWGKGNQLGTTTRNEGGYRIEFMRTA